MPYAPRCKIAQTPLPHGFSLSCLDNDACITYGRSLNLQLQAACSTHILVVLDVLVESPELSRLKDAEEDEQEDAQQKRVDATQHQILHFKTETLNKQTQHETILKLHQHYIFHLFILDISIAPFQVHYYSEALPTQHGYCVGVSRRSATVLRSFSLTVSAFTLIISLFPSRFRFGFSYWKFSVSVFMHIYFCTDRQQHDSERYR